MIKKQKCPLNIGDMFVVVEAHNEHWLKDLKFVITSFDDSFIYYGVLSSSESYKIVNQSHKFTYLSSMLNACLGKENDHNLVIKRLLSSSDIYEVLYRMFV